MREMMKVKEENEKKNNNDKMDRKEGKKRRS